MFAGATGAAAPSKAAEAVAALLSNAPGTDEVLAQAVQAVANMAVVGTQAMAEAGIRQCVLQGTGADYQNIIAYKAIIDGANK